MSIWHVSHCYRNGEVVSNGDYRPYRPAGLGSNPGLGTWRSANSAVCLPFRVDHEKVLRMTTRRGNCDILDVAVALYSMTVVEVPTAESKAKFMMITTIASWLVQPTFHTWYTSFAICFGNLQLCSVNTDNHALDLECCWCKCFTVGELHR